jgi:hypothetical protein
MILSRFSSVPDDPLCFRLIHWNSTPATATNQPLPDDSSESNNFSPVPYGELDALRFKAELEVAQHDAIAELTHPQSVLNRLFD